MVLVGDARMSSGECEKFVRDAAGNERPRGCSIGESGPAMAAGSAISLSFRALSQNHAACDSGFCCGGGAVAFIILRASTDYRQADQSLMQD